MDTPLPGLELAMLVYDEEENLCGICFEELANGSLLPCKHSFCATCIVKLKKQAVYQATEGVMCPNCRTPVREYLLPESSKQVCVVLLLLLLLIVDMLLACYLYP